MDEPTDQTNYDPAVARAAASAPTAEQLELWIAQNKKMRWRSILSIALIAVGFAIVAGAAVSNVLVLNKLDERGAGTRKIIERIDQGVNNTESLLDFTDRLESPETQAENARRTQELLDAFAQRVDCNTRVALLDAVVDVFGEEAAAQYQAKIEALCATRQTTPAGTTTTTSIPSSTGTTAPTTTSSSTSLVPSG